MMASYEDGTEFWPRIAGLAVLGLFAWICVAATYFPGLAAITLGVLFVLVVLIVQLT